MLPFIIENESTFSEILSIIGTDEITQDCDVPLEAVAVIVTVPGVLAVRLPSASTETISGSLDVNVTVGSDASAGETTTSTLPLESLSSLQIIVTESSTKEISRTGIRVLPTVTRQTAVKSSHLAIKSAFPLHYP